MSYYAHTSSANLGIVNTSFPLTSAPITMGGWFYITNSASGATTPVLQISQGPGSNNNNCSLGFFSAGLWFALQQPSGEANSAINVAANRWVYVIGRFIGSTNRRLAHWDPGGGLSQAVDTTTSTQSVNYTTAYVGVVGDSTSFGNNPTGFISHIWFADADIYDSGSDLPTSMVFQLAKHGPLSYPHIARALVDYLPMYSPNSDGGSVINRRAGQYFKSKYGPQIWTANNSGIQTVAANGPDPPNIGRRGLGTNLIRPPAYNLAKVLSNSVSSSTVFRKTLSGIGGRVATRQIEGNLGG